MKEGPETAKAAERPVKPIAVDVVSSQPVVEYQPKPLNESRAAEVVPVHPGWSMSISVTPRTQAPPASWNRRINWGWLVALLAGLGILYSAFHVPPSSTLFLRRLHTQSGGAHLYPRRELTWNHGIMYLAKKALTSSPSPNKRNDENSRRVVFKQAKAR